MSKNNKSTSTAATKWNCSCGKKNIKTKFCPECGKKMPKDATTVKTTSKKKWIIISVAALLVIATAISMILIFSSKKDEGPSKMLSFAQAASITEIEKLDGEQVSIIGYMSTLSPVSGKFMYLMNLPYQSCPFCVPNTTQLSNTLAVYAPNGKSFEFTDRAILVTGTIEVGNWEDEFGYQYSYRIKDASYEILNTDNMSDELKMWQTIAASGVVSDIYSMYDYLSFVCFWSEYTMNYQDGPDYVYPVDAQVLLSSGGQYSYGVPDSFYDNIINKLKEIDDEGLADIITNIENAKQLARDAKAELDAGNYSETTEYSGMFGDGRTQYKMHKYDEYDKQFQDLFAAFSAWMNKWEV